MIRRALVGFAALCAVAVPAAGQQTRLTLGGFSGNFGNNTVAGFDNGFQDSGNMSFTMARISGAVARRVTLYIRASNATLGGGKPLSDLQWRLTTGTFAAITTTDQYVTEGVLPATGSPTSITGNVQFRFLLDWADDAPAVYSTPVVFTMQVTAP